MLWIVPGTKDPKSFGVRHQLGMFITSTSELENEAANSENFGGSSRHLELSLQAAILSWRIHIKLGELGESKRGQTWWYQSWGNRHGNLALWSFSTPGRTGCFLLAPVRSRWLSLEGMTALCHLDFTVHYCSARQREPVRSSTRDNGYA